MAITVVSTTTHNVSTTTTNTVSIPSTSAANTLIVFVGLHTSGTPTLPSITDNEADPSKYTVPVSYLGPAGSPGEGIVLAYRSNTPAGLTTVTVTFPFTMQSIVVTVLEVSGVNLVTPVDTTGSTILQAFSTSDPSGPTVTAATANSLFVACAVSHTNNFMVGVNNSWTLDNVGSAGRDSQGHKIASSSQTYSPTRFNNLSAEYSCVVAVFSPLANSFTKSLSDSIATSDNSEEATDYVKSLSDSSTMSDFIALVLFTGSHFKALLDTIMLADSFAKVYDGIRTFTDEVLLADDVTFIHSSFRTLSDTVSLLDWLSVKKISSDWGN